ncbi:MAG: histidine kinase, partial [Microcoleus sp. SIO2G3]|nr:histidine kinase [Microcoleus sp. SIO2G3]
MLFSAVIRRSSAQQINFGLIIALLLLISTAAVFYRQIDRLQANQRSIQHSYEVRSSLDAVLSTLKDAETGQRGYIITGENQYLEPYQAAIGQIDPQLAQLRLLTAHDPQQQARLAKVEITIDQRLALIHESIDLRRNSGKAAAEQLIVSGRGKALMDSIRQQ